MSLGLSALETLARARSDLRMGLAIALTGPEDSGLALAAETATAERLADLRRLGAVDLAITGRRAETLKARAYDGDVARVALPADADLAWVRATADPSADLAFPLKGPFATRRGGGAGLHRAAIALCKTAHLLPAALVVPLPAGAVAELAAEAGLTVAATAEVPLDAVAPRLGRDRLGAGAARGQRGRAGAGVPAARRRRGALCGGGRRAGPAGAAALPAAFGLFYRGFARELEV